MKITVNIEEDKLDFFLELMNHLDFVKIESVQGIELSDEQKDILDRRLKYLENNPDDVVDWKDFKKEMNK